MTVDRQGNLWVGSEDAGVSVYQASSDGGSRWTTYTVKDGLGDDNAYALACDRLGRIWVGSLNHGVSVYNGHQWRNYGPLEGPLGARVFCIATSPVDGDVWIGTDLGIARYSLKSGLWSYYTRADGIPSDQISALAFDQRGDLFVGTQCDGLAIATLASSYRTFRRVTGPEKVPNTPSGVNLPSSFVNAVLVTNMGTVYVGTDCGLAESWDWGQTWRYSRGEDWRDKAMGRWQGPEPAETPIDGDLLKEDYVTSLAQDASGRVIVGHRIAGLEIRQAGTGRRLADDPAGDGYVTAALPIQDDFLLIGGYGVGLQLRDLSSVAQDTEAKLPAFRPSSQQMLRTATILAAARRGAEMVPKENAALPVPSLSPGTAELKSMLKRVRSLTAIMPKGSAAVLGQDWITQGDWVGRYGRQYANLCAMGSPLDQEVTWSADYHLESEIGPHHNPDDSLRHWVHWLRTDNPKSLYSPLMGYRRQSEKDDHGEDYPMSFEGPDIWINLTLPEGELHRVSLYFFNKDGHDGTNRYRDYDIELKPYRATFADADVLPSLAHERVENFWGGMYTQFVFHGPGRFYIKVARKNSFNTILSGVFVDKLLGAPRPIDQAPLPWMNQVPYDPPKPVSIPAGPKSDVVEAAKSLWIALDAGYDKVGCAELEKPYRLLAYRAAYGASAPASLLANWRWKLPLWTLDDRTTFLKKVLWGYELGIERQQAPPTTPDEEDVWRKRAEQDPPAPSP